MNIIVKNIMFLYSNCAELIAALRRAGGSARSERAKNKINVRGEAIISTENFVGKYLFTKLRGGHMA